MDMILHHATVSSENLKKLTCSKCKKLLSRFPIYMHLKFLHYVCGRCVTDTPDLSDYTRNVAYEQIAECIRFECCHTSEGCVRRLFPSQMEDHEEKHCNYLKYNCALGKGLCSWNGFHNEYLDHVKENHNDLLLNGKQLIDFKKNYEMQYLLANGEELFLVEIQNCLILKKFSCVVYCITKSFNTENVYYKLEFSDLNDKYTLQIFQKINEIYEVSDNGLGHAFCNDEIIHLRVLHIMEVNNKDKENIERPFECPVCLELFLPPIYLCETGHSICEHCKKTVQSECPLCKKKIVNIRNFALEDIVLNKVMSCKNSNCTFTGRGSDIKKHQEWCDKRLASCFYFDVNNKSHEVCNDSIKVCEIYNHVVSKHNSCLLEIDHASQSFIITRDRAIWALKYMSRLFKLHTFRFSNLDYVCWSLQLTGNDEHCKRFKFVVKINIGENSRCLEGPCIPIQQNNYSSDAQKFVNSHIAYKDICHPFSVTILERNK